MTVDALCEDITPAVLGPYIHAASTMIGPVNGDTAAQIKRVVELGIQLYVAAGQAAPAVRREIPIRSFEVTGTLSIEGSNKHRTQIGVDTGQSQYGADCMWTEFEEEAAAERTRAVLESLVGQRVTATKQTFYEYDTGGAIVINGKNEKQTRTRLAPASLHLVAENGNRSAVDLAAAPARSGKPADVDASQALAWLKSQLGDQAAERAWGQLPRTGRVSRGAVQAARAQHTAA